MTEQLQMFDSRATPTATREMLDDVKLRRAIDRMRPRGGTGWPYVERVGSVKAVHAWAVDDGGIRYVVLDGTIFRSTDLWFAVARIRKAALAVFARLDEFNKHGEMA